MRQLTPELLDQLPADDPRAVSSRRDLRRINRFMGNTGWILHHLPTATPHITEIGAGDGALAAAIHALRRGTPITTIDLAPRPDGLPDGIEWIQGDLLEAPAVRPGGTLVANLILHHFTDDQLARIGRWLESFDTWVVNEPLRARTPLLLGRLATPFIHPVTRHDMRVSIEAGFVDGELPATLGLDRDRFTIRESSTWRGSQRMLAYRR